MTSKVFQIGLENNAEGRSQAWVLDQPGCFAYGIDGASALAALPTAIHLYIAWVDAHRARGFSPEPPEISLDETWNAYTIDEDYNLVDPATENTYEVNAWFRHDWKPLSAEEIAHGLEILSWSRADLLETVHSLDEVALARRYPNERWNIQGILKHIGGAEWWYLDRLGLAFPQSEVPNDPFIRLEKVRACLNEVLPKLVGSRQVIGLDGEFWSPRKLLRRAAWHERDHIEHIQKLLHE